MAFRLRYLAHDLELPVGEFVIGRSTDCQLSLDDPLVSRRHAVLRIRRDGVSIEDLKSRNGVIVNGTKIDRARELNAGDKISIGSQEMVLQASDEARPRTATNDDDIYRRATQTLGAGSAIEIREAMVKIGTAFTDPPTAEASRSLQSFQLLGGVADKAFAMGRAEEAERILQSLLVDVMQRVRDGQPLDASVTEAAAKYAARLGGATTKGTWIDYVFELYKRLKLTLPAPVIDELYSAVRKAKAPDIALFRSYLADLRKSVSSAHPAQRFLIQRIEGLEQLLSLK